MLAHRLAGVAALAASALAQLQTIDTDGGITVGFAISDVDEPPFDVIVSISAPADVGWAGVAWGGDDPGPLSIAWSSGGSVVTSSRWTEHDFSPRLYDGASLFVFPVSGASSSRWTATFLCQGCSEWEGGGLDPSGENGLAVVVGAQFVDGAADPDMESLQHSEEREIGFDFRAARLGDEEWDGLVSSLWGVEDKEGPEDGPYTLVYPEEDGLGSEDEVGEEIVGGQELRRRQDDGPIQVIIISSGGGDPAPTATAGDPEPTEDVEEPEPEPEPTESVEEPEEPSKQTTTAAPSIETIEPPVETTINPPSTTEESSITEASSSAEPIEPPAETAVEPSSAIEESSATEAPSVAEPTDSPAETTIDVPTAIEPEPTGTVDEPEETPQESTAETLSAEPTGSSGGIIINLPSTTETLVISPSTSETLVELPNTETTAELPSTAATETTAEPPSTQETTIELPATTETTAGPPSTTETTAELPISDTTVDAAATTEESTTTEAPSEAEPSAPEETTVDSPAVTENPSFTLVPDDPISTSSTSSSTPPALTNRPVPDDPIVSG